MVEIENITEIRPSVFGELILEEFETHTEAIAREFE